MKIQKPASLKKSFTLFACFVVSQILNAGIIADFVQDFRPQDPTPGWNYQWNPGGVELGNHKEYKDLETADGMFRMVVDAAAPPLKDGGQANARWLQIRKGIMSPGDPKSLSTDGLDHYAIVSYTLQPEEAGYISITNSRIKRKLKKEYGKFSVFVNETLIGSDTVKADAEFAFDVPLGALDVGDTIYVAFGPGETTAVSANVQFQISSE